MADRMFDAKYIDEEFGRIGARVKEQLGIYLIGGCAMSFRKLKESTKDVDIVFRNGIECGLFCDALFGTQYHEPHPIKPEHELLQPTKVYENKDGFHLDLFVKQICEKLMLSERMIKRAELYKKYGNLSVYLVSKEDIFLFKGLASEGRKRDLPDMKVIYPNLDWKVIETELETQELSADLNALFIRRLEEFSETYKLDVPILGKLRKLTGDKGEVK
ncbi:MAG: hypothetical protein ABII22_06090 [Candidatus Micrarchaeota archaeon]